MLRTVSQENVEVVRQSLDAYSRRDVNALRAVNDPNLELDWSRSVGWLAGVYRGFDAALRFYEGYFQAFQQVVVKPERFIDIGEFVVVPNVAHQQGRDGIEVSARSTLVFEVREGKIIRICLYQETEEALNAVGLEESAMSENLGLVRSIFAAWERGDFSSAEWADPEIEFVMVGGDSPGSWKGLAGMAEAFRGWLSAWEGFRVRADEYRELDDERVLVLLYGSGRGKLSGLEMGQLGTRGANLFHIRGHKVTRLVLHWDRDRALADLGLQV